MAASTVEDEYIMRKRSCEGGVVVLQQVLESNLGTVQIYCNNQVAIRPLKASNRFIVVEAY